MLPLPKYWSTKISIMSSGKVSSTQPISSFFLQLFSMMVGHLTVLSKNISKSLRQLKCKICRYKVDWQCGNNDRSMTFFFSKTFSSNFFFLISLSLYLYKWRTKLSNATISSAFNSQCSISNVQLSTNSCNY